MVLIFHIAVAIFSMAFATYLYIQPSKTKIYSSYGLIALTLLSGTYLLWTTKSHILQGCLMGLIYTASVLALNILAGKKLATEKTRS